MSIQRKKTERMELVETHNLALSIHRLRNGAPYDEQAWRRALYHAVLLSGPNEWELRPKLRETLHLP